MLGDRVVEARSAEDAGHQRHRLIAQGSVAHALIVSGYVEDRGLAPDLPRLTKPFRGDELAAVLAQVARR